MGILKQRLFANDSIISIEDSIKTTPEIDYIFTPGYNPTGITREKVAELSNKGFLTSLLPFFMKWISGENSLFTGNIDILIPNSNIKLLDAVLVTYYNRKVFEPFGLEIDIWQAVTPPENILNARIMFMGSTKEIMFRWESGNGD